MKYDVVIFDLDGTILNTLDDLADSLNHVLEANNFPTHTIDEVRMFVGNGIRKLIERALPQDTDEATRENIYKQFSEYYGQHSQDKTRPYDGIPELFNELRNVGIKIAVNTNKDEDIAKVICEKYFPGMIDVIAGGRKDTPIKPAPAGVNKILKTLNIPKEEALYVGDSDVDIQTGANCGIDEIGVAWGFRGEEFLRQHGAKTVFSDVEQLKKYILLTSVLF